MKRVIFVSQCIMNKTLKKEIENVDILGFFAQTDVGIIQMPCPKFNKMNFKKESQRIVTQIEKYKKKKYNVLAVVGMENSSNCAVYKKKKGYGRGALFEEIEREMEERNFQVPLFGFDSKNPFTSLNRLKILVKNC